MTDDKPQQNPTSVDAMCGSKVHHFVIGGNGAWACAYYQANTPTSEASTPGAEPGRCGFTYTGLGIGCFFRPGHGGSHGFYFSPGEPPFVQPAAPAPDPELCHRLDHEALDGYRRLVSHLPAAPAPAVEECVIVSVLSCVCARGTKSCNVDHAPAVGAAAGDVVLHQPKGIENGWIQCYGECPYPWWKHRVYVPKEKP